MTDQRSGECFVFPMPAEEILKVIIRAVPDAGSTVRTDHGIAAFGNMSGPTALRTFNSGHNPFAQDLERRFQ